MTQRALATLIVVGVLCWGAFHARGAYLLNRNLGRPAIVFGCVLLFLAAFVAVFRVSRRKLEEREDERLRAEVDEEGSGSSEP